MKLNKEQEAAVMLAHETYWESYLKGDVESLASLLDEGYSQIGSVENEVFFNKKDAVNFVQTTINQVAGKVEMRNRITKLEPGEESTFITEQCDLYVLIEGEWNFYSKFRASSMMHQKDGKWKMIHQHSSLPDAKAQEGENIATEKIAAENLQLREAVKRRTFELVQKNRELEIETSLERVRAIAMGMKHPADMLDVCRIISAQLELLNITHIRNVQTAIFYESRGIYLNYEYFSIADKTVITEVEYNLQADVKEFVNKMQQDAEAFFTTSFEGAKLKAWMAYQEKANQYVDSNLHNATSLNYYFYSIGPGALGISTYRPLNADQLLVFKRFRNVFELAYRRFIDIEKAIAQAKEAHIEASLERVRAAALVMRTPGDLTGICEVLFRELTTLGFGEIRNAMINIHDDEKSSFVNYDYSDEIGKSINHLVYNIHPVIEKQIKQIRSGGDAFSETSFTGSDLEDWKAFRKRIGEKDDPRIEKTDALFYYFYSIGTGAIGISTFSGITDEKKNILKRFRNVFDFAYRRYMDVALAETQAREAQIELALERIRARTMAMQRSEELAKTVSVLFKQLLDLGIKSTQLRTCGIVTFNQHDPIGEIWISDTKGEIVDDSFITRYDEAPAYKKIYTDWKNGEKFGIISLLGDAFYEHLNYLLQHTKIPVTDTSFIQKMEPEMHLHVLYFSQGYLFIITYKPMPEYHEIFNRFGAVFQQTYTRFLDFKKAEAQTKEAQIETALERVRSRTMGMQKSDELKEVIKIVYQQLSHLKINLDHAGFVVDYKPGGDWHFWIADEQDIPARITHPYFESVWANQFNEAKENGTDFFATNLNFEEKNKFYNELLSYVPGLPEASKDFYLGCPGLAASTVLLENVGLYIENFSGIPYSDEENYTLMRFGKVFQQTYTRFLDLQKAEAQAMEAKIEAALEKVRSRSLAVHKSNELKEVVSVIFEKLQELAIPVESASINIFIEGTKDVDVYSCGQNNDRLLTSYFRLPYFDHPVLNDLINARETGLDFIMKTYTFEEKNSFYEYEFKHSDLKYLPVDVKNMIFQSRHYTLSMALAKNSTILINEFDGRLLSAVEIDILKRFSKVFEQAYIRFLDLKKSEVQTRQAQIETALEKVRARALAMQKPGELVEVAQVLRKEMGLLGVEELETSSIYIHDEASGKTECWYAIKDNREPDNKLVSDHMIMQLSETWVGRQMLEFYHSDKKQISILMQGANRKEWIEYCIAQSKVFDNTFYGADIPDRTYHLNKFSNGYIGAASPGDISVESRELLKRATTVFSLAYTRFSDLQKSEANAREAVRQASLDRVRAETASMRTTADLERITPLIWNELTTQGVPFIRCGVFIMDEQQQQIHTFLSTPGGAAIAAFHLPYSTPGTTVQVLDHWRKKKIYKEHWDEAAFMEWTKNLQEQGAITSTEKYLTQHHPTNLDLHFLPFLQGMLYVGSETVLGEEELHLVQNLADAFSTAYARYEDFKKLEAAKAQIEHTLVNLKQAQAQLIQSEKMASLGELTAGIAHEIQNPLNFVNNFSEVNTELIEELKIERQKAEGERNTQLEDELLNDLSNNLEKINHHGKRADAIVKGMLQHSRTNTAEKEPTDINKLADEYLRLAYHGLRAKDKSFNATLKTDYDDSIGKINIIPQDIGRVILNLINNAFYATQEKKKLQVDQYEPVVSVSSSLNPPSGGRGAEVFISVKDNGPGIPQKILDKIFQPFFTTKPTGQGTGLGLSLSYDIVKAHGGELKVETREGEGAEFIIQLPVA